MTVSKFDTKNMKCKHEHSIAMKCLNDKQMNERLHFNKAKQFCGEQFELYRLCKNKKEKKDNKPKIDWNKVNI